MSRKSGRNLGRFKPQTTPLGLGPRDADERDGTQQILKEVDLAPEIKCRPRDTSVLGMHDLGAISTLQSSIVKGLFQPRNESAP